MDVSTLEWSITLGVTIAVLLFDVIVIARDPHEPSMRVEPKPSPCHLLLRRLDNRSPR